jgi:hypothetical protein
MSNTVSLEMDETSDWVTEIVDMVLTGEVSPRRFASGVHAV